MERPSRVGGSTPPWWVQAGGSDALGARLLTDEVGARPPPPARWPLARSPGCRQRVPSTGRRAVTPPWWYPDVCARRLQRWRSERAVARSRTQISQRVRWHTGGPSCARRRCACATDTTPSRASRSPQCLCVRCAPARCSGLSRHAQLPEAPSPRHGRARGRSASGRAATRSLSLAAVDLSTP